MAYEDSKFFLAKNHTVKTYSISQGSYGLNANEHTKPTNDLVAGAVGEDIGGATYLGYQYGNGAGRLPQIVIPNWQGSLRPIHTDSLSP